MRKSKQRKQARIQLAQDNKKNKQARRKERRKEK